MKIECPHCTQRIEAGNQPPRRFACPTCNGQIDLDLRPVSKKSDEFVGGRAKPALLIGACITSIVLGLLAGWVIWDKRDQAEETNTAETTPRPDGEQPTRSESSTPEEKVISQALKQFWSAKSVEGKLSTVRKQPETEKRIRDHYRHEAFKPESIKLISLQKNMKNFSSSTKSSFDVGEEAPEDFMFAEYSIGSEWQVSRGLGRNRCDMLEIIRDAKENVVEAKIDWESMVGWNPTTSKALRAQRPLKPTIVRCQAVVDSYNQAISDAEREMGWISLRLDLPEASSDLIYAAVSPAFREKNEILSKIRDGETHRLVLEITHRGKIANDFIFIVTDYINDSWFIQDEAKHFSELDSQRFPIRITDVRDHVSRSTNQKFTENNNSVTFFHDESRGFRDPAMFAASRFVANKTKSGVKFMFFIRGGYGRTGDWAATNTMTTALKSPVFTWEESTKLAELLGKLGDIKDRSFDSPENKRLFEKIGRFDVEAGIVKIDAHYDRLTFWFSTPN